MTVRPNPEFPFCAQVARHMLAEAIGCKPGDRIPPHDVLIAAAREIVTSEAFSLAADKAHMALKMIEEIGGL